MGKVPVMVDRDYSDCGRKMDTHCSASHGSDRFYRIFRKQPLTFRRRIHEECYHSVENAYGADRCCLISCFRPKRSGMLMRVYVEFVSSAYRTPLLFVPNIAVSTYTLSIVKIYATTL
jgi:hypothetical protein